MVHFTPSGDFNPDEYRSEGDPDADYTPTGNQRSAQRMHERSRRHQHHHYTIDGGSCFHGHGGTGRNDMDTDDPELGHAHEDEGLEPWDPGERRVLLDENDSRLIAVAAIFREALRKPLPLHEKVRWRLRLYCGHLVEHIQRRDQDSAPPWFECPECGLDAVVVAARPLGLAGPIPCR